MLFDENLKRDEQDANAATQGEATGYRADENNETEEKDLKGSPLFGRGTMKEREAPGMEGEGMGGHNFGNDGNPTPMGDDKDNPSQNAGYSNGYFARTEPLVEDTANNNFRAAHQEGEPDYDQAYNNPGPQEVPGPQKMGEDDDSDATPAYHEPELNEPQPDHGSDGTETGEDADHIES